MSETFPVYSIVSQMVPELLMLLLWIKKLKKCLSIWFYPLMLLNNKNRYPIFLPSDVIHKHSILFHQQEQHECWNFLRNFGRWGAKA